MKSSQKALTAIVSVLVIGAIVFVANPKWLQGNLGQLTQLQNTSSGTAIDYTSRPTVKVLTSSNSIQDGINSVMATAIENKADTTLKTLQLHLTLKDVTLKNFRLFLNGKDLTASLDSDSQKVLAAGYTSLGQYTSTKDVTLTSSTGINLAKGTNTLELKTSSQGTARDSSIMATLTNIVLSQNGVESTLSVGQ